jgi:putative transposase
MPSPFPEKVTLSIKIKNILRQIANCTSNPYRLVRRAKIILEAANGANNTIIADKFDLSRSQVRYWCQKWQDNYDLMIKAESKELDDKKIRSIITAILDDQPRAGRPNTYTTEQIVQILSIACEEPSESGRPISHWSRRELKAEAVKRGIVDNISPRTVGRFLKGSHLTASPLPLLAQSEKRQ